jgi:hypothetical protein
MDLSPATSPELDLVEAVGKLEVAPPTLSPCATVQAVPNNEWEDEPESVTPSDIKPLSPQTSRRLQGLELQSPSSIDDRDELRLDK